MQSVAGGAAQPEIFTSDLMRAAQTASILADVFAPCTPRAMPDLREISYGEAEGKPQQ